MGDRKIKNMEEFAEVSGISRPTISKYFNDPDSVKSSTRHRIEAALADYDYRPNIYAVNQNRQLTKNIGIVVPYLADPFFAEIARNIERRCINAGFSPVLFSSHGDPEHEIDILNTLRSIKPAGVLMAPLGRVSNRKVLEAFCNDVPTVLFDSFVEGIGEAFVGSNNDQSIDLIVEYLCNTGDPPCFFEMETPVNPNARRRQTAYSTAMSRMGLTPMIFRAEGTGWDFEAIGYREGMRGFSEGLFPSSTLLCSNDRLAIGVLSAAYELGMRVGRSYGHAIRIAGHDDHPFSRYTCPPLTTVSQDYASIADRSAETLLTVIESGSRQDDRHEIFFDGKLIIRESA